MSPTEQGLIETNRSQKGGLRFVVALKPEADPLIRRFGLTRTEGAGAPWAVWRDSAGDICLVVSGIGKAAASGAAAWLHAVSGQSPAAAWVNFGIAGHGTLPPGEIRRIHKITDQGNGRSWYPPLVVGGGCGLDSECLLTVDRPASTFPGDGSLVDMEASGFFPVAQKFATAELIHCVKIVSDNAETGIAGINPKRIRELAGTLEDRCRESGFFDALQAASEKEFHRLLDPPEMRHLAGRYRFSETQRHQLRRLLQRGHALGMGPEFFQPDCRDAKSALQFLREKLSQRLASP